MEEPKRNFVPLNNSSSIALKGEVSTYVINQLQTHLFPVLEHSISLLLDHVTEQTNITTCNTQVMGMMEVQQKLKHSQKSMLKDFKKQLINNFEEWEQTSVADLSKLQENDLSLVDNTVLEQKLAWQLAARHIEYCDDLQCLYNCESRLQNIVETTPEKNPFGAQKICESFATILATLELDLEVTQDLMSNFARQIRKPVNKIWVEADNYLEELGLELECPKRASIAPADKPQPEGTDSGDSASSSGSTSLFLEKSGESQIDDDNDFVSSLAQQVVSKVESLLGNRLSDYPNEDQSSIGIRLAPTDLAYALTSIQDELLTQHSCLDNLAESVRTGLATRGMANHLSPRHEDLINMVGMLFEYILEDYKMPEEIKNLIGLLQIPVLKLALLEKEFLTDRKHPGRILLNQMATAGMQCTGSDDPVIELIEKTVKTIFKHFIDQPDIFIHCLESFNRDLAALEELQQKAQESTSEETASPSFERTHDPVIEATDDSCDYHGNPVDLIIQSYRERHEIPELLDDMVAIGWQQVLEHAWQQDLSDENWYHYTNTMDMLLWNIPTDRQQKLPPEHWETMKDHVITLLNEIGFNPLIMAEWLQAINVLTTRRLSFDDEEIVIEQVYETIHELQDECEDTENNDSPEEPEYQSEDSPLETTEFIPINNLRTGQWVEFLGNNNRQLRCKLTSINKETNRYIFVNMSGMKVSEWSGTDLEKGIKAQKIRILENTQFFDRALQAVMDNFLKF